MMIMGLLAGDSGHMHSWGSIFVQDVILPLRKKPMTPRQHIWALRLAVMGVAAFAFVFSLLFQQTQYIALWWALTAGVFTGGAGAAIIGGLYWQKGTTAAAWAATITGSVALARRHPADQRHDLAWLSAVRAERSRRTACSPAGEVLAQRAWKSPCSPRAWPSSLYVIVSLLTPRERSTSTACSTAASTPAAGRGAPAPALRERFRLKNILQFDANFTFSDKLVAGGIFWWAMFLLAVNLSSRCWNLLRYRTGRSRGGRTTG